MSRRKKRWWGGFNNPLTAFRRGFNDGLQILPKLFFGNAHPEYARGYRAGFLERTTEEKMASYIGTTKYIYRRRRYCTNETSQRRL